MRHSRGAMAALVAGSALLGACGHGPESESGASLNILLVITDDIGMDRTSAYGGRVETPHIDALAASGMRFTNAYSNPSCSPSRVSLLTGRHASRTGVGRWLSMHDSLDGLSAAEVTLPELLTDAPGGYTSAAIGKWHMNTAVEQGLDVLDAPRERGGFSRFVGMLGNVREASVKFMQGEPTRGYSYWERVVDGVPEWTERYATTDVTDEAIAHMATLPEPWFLWVAYPAAHEPWHVPPAPLLIDTTLEQDAPVWTKMDEMVRVTDAQVGRLLDAMSDELRERTVVIYAADNGTAEQVTVAPWDEMRAKGTTFDGGVNVPFIVSGPMVAAPGTTSDALLHFVDVFPLVAQLAGAPVLHDVDGQSFLATLLDPDRVEGRPWVFTESFTPGGASPDPLREVGYITRMVRDHRYKLRRVHNRGVPTEELYRYTDPDDLDEGPDLLVGALTAEDEAAYLRLGEVFDWVVEGF